MQIMVFRVILAILILLSCSFVRAEKSLVFSIANDSGMPSKVCSKVMQQALKLLGMELNLMDLPLARSLREANNGNVDGEIARIGGLSNKFTNILMIKTPCYTDKLYIFVQSGKDFEVAGWESFPKDYILGYRRGTQFIENTAKNYPLTLYPVGTREQMVLMLSKGRVDGAIGGYNLISYHLKSLDLPNIIRLKPSFDELVFYSYIHKKHTNLLGKLEQVLGDMESKGAIKDIKTRVSIKMHGNNQPVER